MAASRDAPDDAVRLGAPGRGGARDAPDGPGGPGARGAPRVPPAGLGGPGEPASAGARGRPEPLWGTATRRAARARWEAGRGPVPEVAARPGAVHAAAAGAICSAGMGCRDRRRRQLAALATSNAAASATSPITTASSTGSSPLCALVGLLGRFAAIGMRRGAACRAGALRPRRGAPARRGGSMAVGAGAVPGFVWWVK